MFYTYVWLILKDERWTPIYVGKGKGNRAYDHRDKTNRKSHLGNTLRKYPHHLVQHWQDSEDDAFAYERLLIRCYGRADLNLGPLLNKTDGGEGSSGLVFPQSAREALRRHFTGRKVQKTPQACENIRAAMVGHKLSEQTKQKISAALVGRPAAKRSPETRAKMAAAKRRYWAAKKAKLC